MRIIDCEQRSPEWYVARRGIPTASEFGKIIQPVRGGYAAAADEYINRLIDEVVRPDIPRDGFSNRHTERGCELEPEARDVYAFENDVALRQVGFVLNDEGTLGCSPDSMVLEENPTSHLVKAAPTVGGGFTMQFGHKLFAGGLEVKCPDGPTHVGYLRNGGLPAEYKAQVHGSLIVTGLPWWDFMSYCPPYRPLILRVVPDSFTDSLRTCLERFLGEYKAAKEGIGCD